MSHKPIVLMYHGIISDAADIPADREAGADLYDVYLEAFQKQIEHFKAQDYYVTTLRGGFSLEKKNVIVTFDDGEKNNFTRALPLLQQYKFPAYFFIAVDNVGRKGYMNWEEIKELRDAEMIVGSHGMTHRILTSLKDKEVERELIRSKDILEQNLKVNVDNLSIPRGFYDERILQIASEAGYKNIFVSGVSSNSDTVIGRVAVRKQWGLGRFKQALQGDVPAGEKVFEKLKTIAKKGLGHGLYDKVRRKILGNRN